MLPITFPPNCRIISRAGRKHHSSFFRLSSKSIVLSITFVFLGDLVLVFKNSLPLIIPSTTGSRSVLKFRSQVLASFFRFAFLP